MKIGRMSFGENFQASLAEAGEVSGIPRRNFTAMRRLASAMMSSDCAGA
jgi:hypothetical protein